MRPQKPLPPEKSPKKLLSWKPVEHLLIEHYRQHFLGAGDKGGPLDFTTWNLLNTISVFWEQLYQWLEIWAVTTPGRKLLWFRLDTWQGAALERRPGDQARLHPEPRMDDGARTHLRSEHLQVVKGRRLERSMSHRLVRYVSGERMVFSTHAAEKTRYPQAKNEFDPLPKTISKSYLKMGSTSESKPKMLRRKHRESFMTLDLSMIS